MDSLRGKLLLASPDMGDPNFERTVILLIQHADEGAMGLILNRPTPLGVCAALLASEGGEETPCDTEELLFKGGPCEGPLMALHGDADFAQDMVCDGVYLATDKHLIEPVLAGTVTPARFFAGYAGWGGGQLEGEIAAGAWVVADAQPHVIFDPGPDPWPQLIRANKPGDILKNFNPKIVPRDPSMN